MIFYFTGTGNSMWTAKTLGEALEQPIRSIVSDMSQDTIPVSDDLIGFVFPTYINDIPWIAKEFLLKLQIDAKSYCFTVMTSNNGKSGRAARSIDHALHTNGATLSAHFNLQMPGNCIESSDAENNARLAAAPAKLDAIIGQIRRKTVNFVSDGERTLENFISDSYFFGSHSLRRLTIMKQFRITGACTGCGLCEKLCPTQNISIINQKAVHGDCCTACYACLHWCPVHATLPKFFLIRNRKQYTHPNISLAEILQSEKAGSEK